ncbi:MAG: cyclase family protein [Methanomicrobiales archaeon]
MIDLTHKLYDKMPVYPGDPPVSIAEIKNHENEPYSFYQFSGNMHIGTHLDAPYHYHSKGRKISKIKLSELIKMAEIIDVDSKKIELNHAKNKIKQDIVIFRTGWSINWGQNNYFTQNPYLSEKCAKFLVKKNVKGVGIDSPSVDAWGENLIHKILLENDVWIVENLNNLDKISKEKFKIYIIPLLIDSEASPVRVFAKLD